MEKKQGTKIGLVLEGGAMRGMYTAGVLDVMMKEKLWVDEVVGVSAGALFGVNYVSKQIGRTIRYNKKYNSSQRYMGLLPLLTEGNIVSTKYAYHKVPFVLDPFDDQTFMESGIPFYAVVTEVETATPEYIEIKSGYRQMDVLRASGSMPFVSKPVKIGEKEYLDGGIVDSIPFRWMMEHGCEKVMVILTRDMEYRKKPMPEKLLKLYARKHPKLAEQLRHRHEVYNHAVEELKELEKNGKVLVIRPSKPITIKRLERDPEKLQQVYDLGVLDAYTEVEQMREFLSQS